ncbi:MAG: tyrosine-type recombinase/integrase [Planctomycetota bacterium]
METYCKPGTALTNQLTNKTGKSHRTEKLNQKSGVSKLHPHMLRHTYLTRLYNVEHDLRFVQDQAGHARKRQVEALGDL